MCCLCDFFLFKVNAKSIGSVLIGTNDGLTCRAISRILNNTCCNNVNKKMKQIKKQSCECDVF